MIMQLARDLYLSDKKTYSRNLKEIILALRLNEAFSKQKIFQLYVNKIYLGQGAYGVVAAAQRYYQKPLTRIDLAQVAMIGGLLKAPWLFNPVANAWHARRHHNYVLTRMHVLGMISAQRLKNALNSPATAKLASSSHVVHHFRALFVAEMVHKQMVARFGKKGAYTAGYQVVTTVTSKSQGAARATVRDDIQAYAKQHRSHASWKNVFQPLARNTTRRHAKLETLHQIAGSHPTIVTQIDRDQIMVAAKHVGQTTISSGNRLRPHQAASTMLAVGDIVRLRHATAAGKNKTGNWHLTEIPNVEGGLVSLNLHNGAIRALVRGYNYECSKFNQATQARRQPGSAFKPLLNSAAPANGVTKATLVNDASAVYYNSRLDLFWRPHKSSGQYFGLSRLRGGLVHSRNLVSIRVLRRIAVNSGVQYATRCGFFEIQLPHNLTLARCSASLSPMQIARGYSAFGKESYLITPYLIKTMHRSKHKLVYRANPERAYSDRMPCPEQIQPASTGDVADPSTPRASFRPKRLSGRRYDAQCYQARHRTHALKLHRKDLSATLAPPITILTPGLVASMPMWAGSAGQDLTISSRSATT